MIVRGEKGPFAVLSSVRQILVGQVGEWLKPTDCKSVPPWRYEGSNPSLSTMQRRPL